MKLTVTYEYDKACIDFGDNLCMHYCESGISDVCKTKTWRLASKTLALIAFLLYIFAIIVLGIFFFVDFQKWFKCVPVITAIVPFIFCVIAYAYYNSKNSGFMDNSEQLLQKGVNDYIPSASLNIISHDKSHTFNSTGVLVAAICAAVAFVLLFFAEVLPLIRGDKNKDKQEEDDEEVQMKEIE